MVVPDNGMLRQFYIVGAFSKSSVINCVRYNFVVIQIKNFCFMIDQKSIAIYNSREPTGCW